MDCFVKEEKMAVVEECVMKTKVMGDYQEKKFAVAVEEFEELKDEEDCDDLAVANVEMVCEKVDSAAEALADPLHTHHVANAKPVQKTSADWSAMQPTFENVITG